MMSVDVIGNVRRAFFEQHLPIKEIVRTLSVSRATVRKVIRSHKTEFKYERGVQPVPKLGAWVDILTAILEKESKLPRRERRSTQRLFEELRGHGYDGAHDSVHRFTKVWRDELARTPSHAFVPLSFAPGEAYQFDWSHETITLQGLPLVIKAAHMKLSHSRMPFVRAYFRETQELVFDAHDKAFRFYGGVCRRGIYDNMKTAVEAIFVGKARQYNRRFLQMCSHHLVEPVACTPASGWEKGQVENQVGNLRDQLFRPKPRVASLVELNGWLEDQCTHRQRRRICADRAPPLPFHVLRTRNLGQLRPTGRLGDRAGLAARVIKFAISAERVGLKDSGIGGQMGLGMFAAPVTRIIEDRRRGRGVAKRAPVARIDPDAADTGPAVGQNRHACVVAMQPLGRKDMAFDAFEDRSYRRTAGADLVGQRGQADRHALLGTAFGLPVEWLVLTKFLEQDHRQQIRPGPAARSDMEPRWRLVNDLAVPA